MKETMLKLCKFRVETSQNGYEAYQAAMNAFKYQEKNFNSIVSKWDNISFRNQSLMFDVVILDLNMPIMDGYDACKKIRALYNNCSLMKKESLGLEN